MYNFTYEVSKIIKFLDIESRIVSRAERGGNGKLFNGDRITNLQDEKVL